MSLTQEKVNDKGCEEGCTCQSSSSDSDCDRTPLYVNGEPIYIDVRVVDETPSSSEQDVPLTQNFDFKTRNSHPEVSKFVTTTTPYLRSTNVTAVNIAENVVEDLTGPHVLSSTESRIIMTNPFSSL